MGKVLELLTVNVAVKDLDEGLAKYRAMGLGGLAPVRMPAPPAEITDVSHPIGREGAISVIAATGPGSPVARFLAKRGEGVYSIALRVDDLDEIMAEWAEAGLEWVLPAPHAFAGPHPAARHVPERLRVNWVKPSSLNGVMIEVFEFRGKVGTHPAA